MYNNMPYSPYAPMANVYGQNMYGQTPAQSVTRVNGENGARAYQIPPNSSALLLDETAPLVWLIQTDGAGYKTVSPYDIAPHQQATAEQADTRSLEARVKKLEDYVDEQQSHSAGNRKKGNAEP